MPRGFRKDGTNLGFKKGHKINTGKKRTNESKIKMSKSQKKRFESKEERDKISKRNSGRKRSEKAKKETSESLKRHYKNNPMPESRKKKIRDSQKGIKRPNISGKNHYLWKVERPKCQDCRKELGSFKNKYCKKCASKGERNSMWIDGRSSEPYSINWTETLRRSIRERDGYICQMPGCNKQQGDKAFDVHHIDYNKENCNPKNLITLCHSCHSKTNNKNRDYWIQLFQNLIVMHYEEIID